MTWYTYVLPPIDFGWENPKTVRETAAAILASSTSGVRPNDVDAADLNNFLESWRSAKAAASAAGWEGDFREEPVVMWLPNESEFKHGFVLKQDNNGETYVVSPVELPWLEDVD
jgi:hypothetical protein